MPVVKITVDIFKSEDLGYRDYSASFIVSDAEIGITKKLYILLCKRLSHKLNEYMKQRAKTNRNKQLPKSPSKPG